MYVHTYRMKTRSYIDINRRFSCCTFLYVVYRFIYIFSSTQTIGTATHFHFQLTKNNIHRYICRLNDCHHYTQMKCIRFYVYRHQCGLRLCAYTQRFNTATLFFFVSLSHRSTHIVCISKCQNWTAAPRPEWLWQSKRAVDLMCDSVQFDWWCIINIQMICFSWNSR